MDHLSQCKRAQSIARKVHCTGADLSAARCLFFLFQSIRSNDHFQGVYDITEFVEGHPGGDKVLMAAGASVEPYWALYAQHNKQEVMEILEELRIGTLHEEDVRTKMKEQEVH